MLKKICTFFGASDGASWRSASPAAGARPAGPLAAGGPDLAPHRLRDLPQGLEFRQRVAQRIVHLDAGNLEGFRVDVGAVEGLDVDRRGLRDGQAAEVVHPHDAGSDFQQGVFLRVEAAGFNIHDDGQKTPEPIGNARHNGPRSTSRGA